MVHDVPHDVPVVSPAPACHLPIVFSVNKYRLYIINSVYLRGLSEINWTIAYG